MSSRAGGIILGDSSSASHDIDIEETSSTNSESLTPASETTHTISKPDIDFPVLNTKTIVMSDSNQNQLTRDKTMQKCSGSEGDITLDVDSLPSSSNQQKRVRKTSVKTPGLSKKDKCPCQTSDTSSWKPKCSKCNQTSVRPEIRFRFRFRSIRSIFSDPVPVRFRPNTDRIDRI